MPALRRSPRRRSARCRRGGRRGPGPPDASPQAARRCGRRGRPDRRDLGHVRRPQPGNRRTAGDADPDGGGPRPLGPVARPVLEDDREDSAAARAQGDRDRERARRRHPGGQRRLHRPRAGRSRRRVPDLPGRRAPPRGGLRGPRSQPERRRSGDGVREAAGLDPGEGSAVEGSGGRRAQPRTTCSSSRSRRTTSSRPESTRPDFCRTRSSPPPTPLDGARTSSRASSIRSPAPRSPGSGTSCGISPVRPIS